MSGRRLLGRLTLLQLLAGAPAVMIATLAVLHARLPWFGIATALLLLIGPWVVLTLLVFGRTRYHLQTVSNMVVALREGDTTYRLHAGSSGDPFGEVMLELNRLAEGLSNRLIGDLSATALLRKVLAEIGAVVVAFDEQQRLRMSNRRAEELLGAPAAELEGATAAELGLTACLEGDAAQTIPLCLGGEHARWEMRRGSFRLYGELHQLVVLSDVSEALRAEELKAMQRLIRLLNHELKNSLAPIRSLATSLQRLLQREPPAEDWREDAQRGLTIISSRAEALHRFTHSCSQLAHLPPPNRRPMAVAACVNQVVPLEDRVAVTVIGGPSCVVSADQDQIEQVLINLLRNAADAVLASRQAGQTQPGGDATSGGRLGGVSIGWKVDDETLEVWIADEGPGIADPSGLFVPFFSTKSTGSGIGLFLAQRIAQAHGGGVSLENRSDGPGCVARLCLLVTE